MQRSLSAICRAFMIFSLCLAIGVASGVDLVALQSVAWARMLLDFSRTAPLAEAVSKTFDGEHPCALCCEIRKAKQSEQNREMLRADLKIDLFFTATSTLVYPPRSVPRWAFISMEGTSRFEAPPVPPPRAA